MILVFCNYQKKMSQSAALRNNQVVKVKAMPKEVVVRKHLKYHQRAFCLRFTMAIFAALVVLAVAGVAIAAIIVDSGQNAVQNICFCMQKINTTESSGGCDARGIIQLRSNDRQIEWTLQYSVATLSSLPTSVYLMGPAPIGGSPTDQGPLAVSLCGTPSTVACDTSEAGFFTGTLTQFNPGGESLKPLIQAILNEPTRYTPKLNTGLMPMGELWAPMMFLCPVP